MKNLLILSIVSIMTTSCGLKKLIDIKHIESNRPSLSNDPALVQYVQKFEETMVTEGADKDFKVGDIPVAFSEHLEENVAGQCAIYSDGKTIEINKTIWKDLDEARRQVVINHELGHCRLGRGHNDEVVNHVNISVMSSHLIDGEDYTKYETYYSQELYSNNSATFKEELQKEEAPAQGSSK